MCGRYRRKSDKQEIAETFQVRVSPDDLDFAPSNDISPGSIQPVVRVNDDRERDMEMMYWGLEPREYKEWLEAASRPPRTPAAHLPKRRDERRVGQ
jgi:putative SOS response-associated peptidase YedK